MIKSFASRIFLLTVLTALTMAAVAQDAPISKGLALPTGFATTTACQSTYTFGSGPSYMKFCITANGNVAQFESPQGYKQMFGDGYGFCEWQSGTIFTDYFDHEHMDSGNWSAPTIIQPNGPNTFPLQIVRSTTTGGWTLSQTFSSNAGEQILKIVMKLTNNSRLARNAYLERYADIDANANAAHNYSLGEATSGLTLDYYGWGHGLEIHTLPNPYGGGLNVVRPNSGGACHETVLSDPYFGDGALQLIWGSSSILPGATKTVTVEYRAM